MITSTPELAAKFEVPAMNTSNLRRSERYARYHQSRSNLLLHIVFVPLFVAGNVALLAALVERRWLLALGALTLTVISLAIQGRGHRGEAVPPEPFTGPVNAVARILLEQWVTFPRFVLSGAWRQALRNAAGTVRRG
ncbi:MAG TPA: terminase [Steroidobacteraceae bacterium]|nr:terminase [Steroidobacteraceae bacterium]